MKLIENKKGNDKIGILEQMIEKRGLTKDEVLELLNPSIVKDTTILDYYDGLKAINLIKNHLECEHSTIGILVDDDVDGLTSASYLYKTIKLLSPDQDIMFFVHETKKHGLYEEISEKILESEVTLLLLPDSSSNNIKYLNEICHEIDVIVLDHHPITDEVATRIISDSLPNLAIVNCKSENNNLMNDNFTGAGMSYLFMKQLDEEYGTQHSDVYIDLIALGQIGDSSNVSNGEIRKIVERASYKQYINTDFIAKKYLDLDRVCVHDYSFGIIPLMNAISRIGTANDKMDLLSCLVDSGTCTITTTKRKKNKETGKFDKIEVECTKSELYLPKCEKIKKQQKEIAQNSMKFIRENVHDNNIAICMANESSIETHITGYIAQQMKNEYNKPCIFLTPHPEDAELLVGSGRGEASIIPDLKQWCLNTGLFEFCEGHDNAFGLGIKKENINEVIRLSSQKLEQDVNAIEVDFLSDKPDMKLIKEINQYRFYFGGKLKEPLLGFTNMKVKKSAISQKGKMLTIFAHGIEFVCFSASPNAINELTDGFGDYTTVDLIGRAYISRWNGKEKHKIMIDKYEVVENNEEEFIF